MKQRPSNLWGEPTATLTLLLRADDSAYESQHRWRVNVEQYRRILRILDEAETKT
jgi:hypothetical protein